MYATEQLSDYNIRLFLAHCDSSSCFPDASGHVLLLYLLLPCVHKAHITVCKQKKREKKQQESRSSDLLPGDKNSLVNTVSFGVKEVTEVRIAVQRYEKVYREKQINRSRVLTQTGLQLSKHPNTKMWPPKHSHWMKCKHDIGGFIQILALN